MKKVLVVILVSIVSFSCFDRKGSGNSTDMDALKAEMAEKDSLLNEVFTSLNDIAANLKTIRAREGIISDAVKGAEYRIGSVSAIKEGIDVIDGLLIDNRKALSQLEARAAELQKTGAQASSLQSLVSEMKAQIEERDKEISVLKVRLVELTGQVELLSGKVVELERDVEELEGEKEKLQDEVTVQIDNLNAGYYIIGARKDLMKKNIIYKSGTVGRTLKVNENKDLDIFIRIDTRYFTDVMIGQKNVELVTTHPEDSYQLVMGERGVYSSLVITDPERFWEYSKILVITHK